MTLALVRKGLLPAPRKSYRGPLKVPARARGSNDRLPRAALTDWELFKEWVDDVRTLDAL